MTTPSFADLYQHHCGRCGAIARFAARLWICPAGHFEEVPEAWRDAGQPAREVPAPTRRAPAPAPAKPAPTAARSSLRGRLGIED